MAQTRFRQPKGAETAGPLSPEEIIDVVTERTPKEEPVRAARRVRAKPFAGGTTIVVRDIDFANGDIDHPTVEWDFRRNDFTVVVGTQLSQEAADYLVNNFPGQFEYA